LTLGTQLVLSLHKGSLQRRMMVFVLSYFFSNILTQWLEAGGFAGPWLDLSKGGFDSDCWAAPLASSAVWSQEKYRLPSGVRGKALAADTFLYMLSLKIAADSDGFGYFYAALPDYD